MSRVAAIYDIHANLPALEAVLDEIVREAVDAVVVGGDVVPGPMPRETMELLLGFSKPVHFIHGNGDRDVIEASAGGPLERVPESFREAVRWSAGALWPKHLQAMAEWPRTVQLEVRGQGGVLFCHATPGDDNQIFTRLTPEDSLRPVFDEVGASVVVCGHTHMQFDRRVGRVRVLNAGSVGMPFGEPGAYWALLGPEIELRRTEYDLGAAAERIASSAYPRSGRIDVFNPPAEEEMLEMLERAALR